MNSETTINLTIPIRLVSEANSSEHWSKKSKRHKQQRMVVGSYLSWKVLPELPIVVTLTRCAPRPYDDDNLATSFKFIRDEIADRFLGDVKSAKGKRLLGRNDSSDQIKWEYKQEKTKSKENYIKIKIEEKHD